MVASGGLTGPFPVSWVMYRLGKSSDKTGARRSESERTQPVGPWDCIGPLVESCLETTPRRGGLLVEGSLESSVF